jgi:hypothetical protein
VPLLEQDKVFHFSVESFKIGVFCCLFRCRYRFEKWFFMAAFLKKITLKLDKSGQTLQLTGIFLTSLIAYWKLVLLVFSLIFHLS